MICLPDTDIPMSFGRQWICSAQQSVQVSFCNSVDEKSVDEISGGQMVWHPPTPKTFNNMMSYFYLQLSMFVKSFSSSPWTHMSFWCLDLPGLDFTKILKIFLRSLYGNACQITKLIMKFFVTCLHLRHPCVKYDLNIVVTSLVNLIPGPQIHGYGT